MGYPGATLSGKMLLLVAAVRAVESQSSAAWQPASVDAREHDDGTDRGRRINLRVAQQCIFVPGKAVGERDDLFGGNNWDEENCTAQVLAHHPDANGVRLHGEGKRLCSAVFGMYKIVNKYDDEAAQSSCYLYPQSAEAKSVCTTAPAACFGVHHDAELQLSNSAIAGQIPTQLGLLHATLESLELSDNAISGSIPSELGALSKLRNLYIDSNRVSGVLPTQLGELTQIAAISLHSNSLSGLIPSEFGRLNPTSCFLIRTQLEPFAPEAAALGPSNAFGCPLPPLSTGCGINGLAFVGRDAHQPGATCGAWHGKGARLAYHPL